MESHAHKETTRAIVSIGAGHGNNVIKCICRYALFGSACARDSEKRKKYDFILKMSTWSFALMSPHSASWVFCVREGGTLTHPVYIPHFNWFPREMCSKSAARTAAFCHSAGLRWSRLDSDAGLVFFHCRCVTPSPTPHPHLPPPPRKEHDHMIRDAWGQLRRAPTHYNIDYSNGSVDAHR